MQQRSSSGSERIKKKAKRITEQYLHNSGLYYLQRFASSKANFIRVMDRKIRKSCRDHTDQNYENCCTLLKKLADKFESAGLLNDDTFTENIVHSLRRRGLSQKAILIKLYSKGIAQQKTLNALAQEDYGEDAEYTAALAFIQRKKLGPYASKQDEKTQQKFFSALARGGFSYDVAKRALNSLL